MTTVGDVMTKDVETLAAEDSLVLADSMMRMRRFRHLPVTRHGKLVGLVTHRDLLRGQVEITATLRVSEEDSFVSLAVGELMTTDVATARASDSAVDAAERILDNKFGCLPVVDEDENLIGIVTEADLLRWAVGYAKAAES